MAPPDVTVVDYGIGNLLSVARAFERVGATVAFGDSAVAIRNAARLVIPGVGAFGDGVRELSARGLVAPIREYAGGGRPLLGICLGMQLLFDGSEEFGSFEGLGIIPGAVKPVPAYGASGEPHKIPHIGWSGLFPAPAAQGWEGSLFEGVPVASAAYFVHSFAASARDAGDELADTRYDGCIITAAVQRGNVSGCQFHPEKSGQVGLRIVANFVAGRHGSTAR